MQKERRLEEFRSFRTSKRRKQRKRQRSDEKEDVKTQTCFVWVRKTQMRNEATKFAIETEEKTFSCVLKIKEFVAFINWHYDFS